MAQLSKRSTIYFDPDIHQALRLKAAITHKSVSELVDDALRLLMNEDEEDLRSVRDRIQEPEVTYEVLLKDLKANGKL